MLDAWLTVLYLNEDELIIFRLGFGRFSFSFFSLEVGNSGDLWKGQEVDVLSKARGDERVEDEFIEDEIAPC